MERDRDDGYFAKYILVQMCDEKLMLPTGNCEDIKGMCLHPINDFTVRIEHSNNDWNWSVQ